MLSTSPLYWLLGDNADLTEVGYGVSIFVFGVCWFGGWP